MTAPERLTDQRRAHREKLTAACPQMTALAGHVAVFARLLAERDGEHLQQWINAATADDLPALHSFIHGLDRDRAAVQAGLTLPDSNGATEGVNNKIKLLKRQTQTRTHRGRGRLRNGVRPGRNRA